MSKALYRKYRSRSLDEIVGQEPIVTSLKNALKTDQLSHAYLFTGPRGVGKTSIARILAHEINNLSYDSDELPLDIIEIDAASNRRIDEIRDLREKVNIAPISSKYKVYIIDEVHMLTREAFNALLKTLEEPPKHVIFILATTEFHKLPETIVSRTQRYNFNLAEKPAVVEHLNSISQKESIDIDIEALNLIAEHGGGSLRDSLSLLDQVRHSSNKVTAESVRQNLGLPSTDLIENIYNSLVSKKPNELIQSLSESQLNGVSPSYLSENFSNYLRLKIVDSSLDIPLEIGVKLMQSLLNVENSSRPDIAIELALLDSQLEIMKIHNQTTHTETKAELVQPPITINKPAADFKTKKIHAPVTESSKEMQKPLEPNIIVDNIAVSDNVLNIELWETALEHIRQTHNTLYSVLRMAKLDESSNNSKITLFFTFPFHQKRISESKNKQVIAETLTKLGIENCEIICEVSTKNTPNITKKVVLEPAIISNESKDNNDTILLQQIKSVFGGAEVLE